MSEEAKGWMTVGELTELLGRAEPSMRVRITVGTAEHDVDDDGTGFVHGSDEFFINAGELADKAKDALWRQRWEKAVCARLDEQAGAWRRRVVLGGLLLLMGVVLLAGLWMRSR